MIDEKIISQAIIESFWDEFKEYLETDVVIVGAGPSGLCAGYYLAKEGIKTVIFERSLRPGGGMPGGGMMMNKIVIQEESKSILEELGISFAKYMENYYLASSLETFGLLLSHAIKKGAKIFNGIFVEDVVLIEEKIQGVVINWSAVEIANLHVDPLTVKSKIVVDATGHGAEVTRVLIQKSGLKLFTPSGGIEGEKPMWAERGEKMIMEHTKEVFPNLYACGMAANTIFGGPRMGPIFGGMLLSGKRVAELIIKKLRVKSEK